MKNMLNLKSILFFCLIFLFSSAHAQDVPKEIDDILNKINDKMVEATLAGEYLSLMTFYSDDVVIMPDFHPALRGKKAFLKRYQEDMKNGIKHHSFNGTVEKRWQQGDEIFERGTFGMAVSSFHSKQPKAYYGSYFQIWKKQSDGTFKISFTIWNLDFNPFES